MGIKTSKALWVGRGKVVRLQQRLSNIWWLTYEYQNKVSIYANGRNITRPCSLLNVKRDGHSYFTTPDAGSAEFDAEAGSSSSLGA